MGAHFEGALDDARCSEFDQQSAEGVVFGVLNVSAAIVLFTDHCRRRHRGRELLLLMFLLLLLLLLLFLSSSQCLGLLYLFALHLCGCFRCCRFAKKAAPIGVAEHQQPSTRVVFVVFNIGSSLILRI